MNHCLVLLNGPTAGASLTLDGKVESVTIGREASRELPLDDHSASRLHARVWCQGGRWQIEDCGSRNGTYVNGQAVERGALEAGDLIRIGDRLLVFMAEGADGATGGLRPSVFAASTFSIRIPAPDKREAFAERVRNEATTPVVRNLSLLCRLATQLHRYADVGQLASAVGETVCGATDAESVLVWLAGADGRLRRVGGKANGAAERSGRLLASLAVQNDEALLVQLPEEGEAGSMHASDEGTAMAVPIPGRSGPRGAIECFAVRGGRGFGTTDLEFAIATAHQLGLGVENIEHREQLEQSNVLLRERVAGHDQIRGSGPAVRELLEKISRVAASNANVLVLGESGTGKELIARSLHALSERSAGPFVAVNCAAFTESLLESELFGHEVGAFTGADQRRIGQFERAHRGTIFLDEIGEMTPGCQAKLLRVLEGHAFERLGGTESVEVDIRVVAATNRDLLERAKEGKFRDDLYYRLRVVELVAPPLRERGGDVLELAGYFVEHYRAEMGRGPRRLSQEAADRILAYSWPGNVRELKNAIERAMVLAAGEEIEAADLGLPAESEDEAAGSCLVSLAEAERRHIERVLRAVDGNKTQACKVLGIGRGTLYKKLETVVK